MMRSAGWREGLREGVLPTAEAVGVKLSFLRILGSWRPSGAPSRSGDHGSRGAGSSGLEGLPTQGVSDRRPRVCVTMPVYNGEPFLRQAIDSVLSQDYPEVVVRVIDNASTDGTRVLLRQFDDPRLSVVLHDEHVPVAANYARAARQQCGDYMLFLAADDRLAPGAITALVEVAEAHPESAFVYGRMVVVQEGSRLRPFSVALRAPRLGSILDVERYVLRNGYNVPLSTILFRTRVPGFEIDPRTRNACDLDLLLKLGRQGARGFGIRKPVLYLREHDGALSENRKMLAEATLDTLLGHRETAQEPTLYDLRARRVLLWAVVALLLAHDRSAAREMVAKYGPRLHLSSASMSVLLVRVPWLRVPLALFRKVLQAARGGVPTQRRQEN